VVARVRTWAGGLPERHGGKLALVALGLILVLALGLRLERAVNSDTDPRRDSQNYARIATALYEDGRFGDEDMVNASDYSPGAPMFFAAMYVVGGAPFPERALIGVALLGAAMVLLVYLLGRRLMGRSPPRAAAAAGLLAALGAAIYPPYLEYNGRLMSEPVGAFLVAAAVLAYLWALDRPARLRRWLVPGALLGAAVMTRPEYLAVAAGLGLVALIVVARRSGRGDGLRGAALLLVACAAVLAPWTIRNALVLDRLVPVSTGAGKAFFIGTYLPGDGFEIETKAELARRFRAPSESLDQLLDRVAAERPELDRDRALSRAGRENLGDYAWGEPLDYAAMLAAKAERIWWRGPGGTEPPGAWTAVHRLLVVLGAGALIMLALRRRVEAAVLAVPLLGISAVGTLLLAATRRTVPLMPLVLALSAVALVVLARAAGERIAARRAVRRPMPV